MLRTSLLQRKGRFVKQLRSKQIKIKTERDFKSRSVFYILLLFTGKRANGDKYVYLLYMK